MLCRLLPSSMAALVAQRASLTRSFFSLTSTSEEPPIFSTATPEASLEKMKNISIYNGFLVKKICGIFDSHGFTLRETKGEREDVRREEN